MVVQPSLFQPCRSVGKITHKAAKIIIDKHLKCSLLKEGQDALLIMCIANCPLSGVQDLLYVATPGEFCGVLSALTGEPSFITVMAAVHSYLIAITKSNLYQ